MNYINMCPIQMSYIWLIYCVAICNYTDIFNIMEFRTIAWLFSVFGMRYCAMRYTLFFFIGFNCAIAVGGAVNDSKVRHHYDAVQCIENNVCTQVTNCFSTHERVILVLISRVAKQRGKYQNSTWVSGETVCHSSTYIILFLTRHNQSINDDKNGHLYTSSLCLTCSIFILLMTSQSIADDVTVTKQLWRDQVNSDI